MSVLNVENIKNNKAFTIHEYHKASLDNQLNKALFNRKVVEKALTGTQTPEIIWTMVTLSLCLFVLTYAHQLSIFWIVSLSICLILSLLRLLVVMDKTVAAEYDLAKDSKLFLDNKESIEVYYMAEMISKNKAIKTIFDKLTDSNPYAQVLDTIGGIDGNVLSKTKVIPTFMVECEDGEYLMFSVSRKSLFSKEKEIHKHRIKDNMIVSSELI